MTFVTNKTVLAAVGLAAAFFSWSQAPRAQAAPPVQQAEILADDSAEWGEEIELPQVMVTAIKGGSRANEDETYTTINRAEIERLGIVNIKQASEVVPNFYMPQYGSRMTSSVYVRGLGTRIDQPVVGLNIDNVPILNKDNFDFDLADIERIEILRGPQNILYGRNTMGGLVNIYTISPLSFNGLRIVGEYGTQNTYKASVGWYKTHNSRLGTAINIYTTGTDGFFRNSYNNSPVGRERLYSGRWRTVWKPSSRFTLENTASLSHSAQNGYPYQSVATGQIACNDTCFYRRLTITDGLTANYRQSDWELSAIASFQYINDNLTLDQDFLPVDYFTLTQRRHEPSATLDLTARGQKGCYNWLAGAFAFYKRTSMAAPVTFFNYGIEQLLEGKRNEINPTYPIRWDERQLLLGSHFTLPTKGVSVYHQSSLDIDRLTLTLGLRWDYEHISLSYHSDANSSYTTFDATDPANVTVLHRTPVIIDDRGDMSKSYSRLLPKISAGYTLGGNHGNLYASFATGYKSGGYNTQMFSDVLQQRIMSTMGIVNTYDIADIISYEPERTLNYEVGAHLQTPDRKLSADMALFYIDCRDQQLTMFPDGMTTGRIMANAGRSRSCGVELAMKWTPLADLHLQASYGYTNAKFRHFSNGTTEYGGNYVPYAPQHTLYVGANYALPLHGRLLDRLEFSLGGHGAGRIYWNEENSLSQPFYMVVDASAKVSHKDCSLELWANNLTGTQYSTFYFVSIKNAFLQRGNRFSAGFTLRWNLTL